VYSIEENTVAGLNEIGKYCLYQYKGENLVINFVRTINQIKCECVQYKSRILCGILQVKDDWMSKYFEII